MEIKGTIVQVLPPQSGISKAANAWKKQEYILENNEGQFPRKICFTCFGQTADTIQLQVGQRIIASFDVEHITAAGLPRRACGVPFPTRLP